MHRGPPCAGRLAHAAGLTRAGASRAQRPAAAGVGDGQGGRRGRAGGVPERI